MAERRDYRLGGGLIVVGAALIALNIWLFITFHWLAAAAGRKGSGALGVLGGTMIIAGIMVLLRL